MKEAAVAWQLTSGKNLPFVMSDDWQKKVSGWLLVDAVSSLVIFPLLIQLLFPDKIDVFYTTNKLGDAEKTT
ncbi:MAG: hypothetical protein RMX68_008830 [Aulosira sp. ZfuVER01]|nr:hypothetical protein [Aulosira sp. ZfuVER01]MDZ7998659.1 hypothetical protein [Aulosira sp. DedVER01a]MDZ8054831.1 hypothetical protein [Aulosira sp. ZfuCHP01]